MRDLTGKKIRITQDTCNHSQEIGSYHVVTDSDVDCVFIRIFGGSCYVNNGDYEVIEEEPKETNKHGLRRVEFIKTNNKAYFHEWAKYSEMMAIVETEEGKILIVSYDKIKFID